MRPHHDLPYQLVEASDPVSPVLSTVRRNTFGLCCEEGAVWRRWIELAGQFPANSNSFQIWLSAEQMRL